MSRSFLRRFAIVLPLVVAAAALPIVRPETKPRVRTWSVAFRHEAIPQVIRAPGDFSLLGVSWPASSRAPKRIDARTSVDGRTWTGWKPLEVEAEVAPDHGTTESGSHTSLPLWTGRRSLVQVRFDGRAGGLPPKGAKVELVDPGPDPTAPTTSAGASPSQPGIITRSGWGADESLRKKKPDYAEPLQLAVVHHTATSDSYNKNQSDDIVRGIYAYHVKTNGWNDIGYNFLVDKYGQIFEGRYGGMTKTVVGAHALGFNKHSTGVSLIGNFGASPPPAVALNSLKRVLAWRLDIGFVDPAGSLVYTSNGSNKYKSGQKVSLKAISAHRDVGKTACPGNPLYGKLGFLRTEAAKDGLPKLIDAKLSRGVVSPNGDGIADGVKLSGRLTSTMTWKADVLNSANAVVSSKSGTGKTIDFNWYAKDLSGTALPQDDYRFKVTATGASGSIRTGYLPLKVLRYPNGTFIQALPSKRTYVVEKNVLRHPSDIAARGTRYRGAEYVNTADDIVQAYKVGPNIGFRDGSVVKVGTQLFVISQGMRRPTTSAVLTALRYNPASIITTTEAAITPHRLGAPLTTGQGYPEGATLKASTGQEAWLMSGVARPFFTRNVRDSYVVRDVDLAGPADSQIADGAMSTPLGFRDGTLVRVTGAPTIYLISDGKRRPFTSDATFKKMGFKTSNVRTATSTELALHPEGKRL